MKGIEKCRSKIGHDSEEMAEAHLQSHLANYPDEEGLSVYLCSFCSRWHVGRKYHTKGVQKNNSSRPFDADAKARQNRLKRR
jgi:hypothetical protein